MSEPERPNTIDSLSQLKEKERNEIYQDSLESLTIVGYKVNKISGKHKYGGVTRIEYKSLNQVINDLKDQSIKEMWTKERLETLIQVNKEFYKGGELTLYIERLTIGAANTEMFTIIVKDSNENELFRKAFENNIPEYSDKNWWNYAYARIDKRIKTPFFVYVVDQLGDTPFKFEILAEKK